MGLPRQPGITHHQRKGDKGRHQQSVQGEDTEIQPRELFIHQNLFNRAFYHGGFPVLAVLFIIRHDIQRDEDAEKREQGNAPEQAGQADDIRQYRSEYQSDCKGDPDADPDKGHRFGAVLFTGGIGQ